MKKITISDLPLYLSQHRGAWGSGHALHNPALWSTYLRFMRSSVLDHPRFAAARDRAVAAPVWLSSDTGVPIASLSLWTEFVSVFGADRQMISDYPVYSEVDKVIQGMPELPFAVLRFPTAVAPSIRLDSGRAEDWRGFPLRALTTPFAACDLTRGGLLDERQQLKAKSRCALARARQRFNGFTVQRLADLSYPKLERVIQQLMAWVACRWADTTGNDVENRDAVFQASAWAWMASVKDAPTLLQGFAAFDPSGALVAAVGFQKTGGWWQFNVFGQNPANRLPDVGPWLLDCAFNHITCRAASIGGQGVLWTCPTVVIALDTYELYKRYLATDELELTDHLALVTSPTAGHSFKPPYLTLDQGMIYG